MSEENICKCEHLFYDHGYEKNENPPPHMKSPCKKCECNYFQRPGSQPHVARSIAKTAARQAEEALAVKVEQQANQRREEGRRKYAEIEAKKVEEKEKYLSNNFPLTKKVEEKEKDLERIRNEYKIKHAGKPYHFVPDNYEWEKKYSAHVLGPLHAGIYYPKSRKPEEHDNNRLSKLLYQNKRWHGDPELTKEEINEICDPMLLVLPRKLPKIIVPVPNTRQGHFHETRCALPIAAGLAAMINGISYNDVLVRVSQTIHDGSRSGRWRAAVKDYAIVEYIKTAENSRIKDQIVLLIDDIKTSGATTRVCADLLVQNGAKQVIILCAAETKLG